MAAFNPRSLTQAAANYLDLRRRLHNVRGEAQREWTRSADLRKQYPTPAEYEPVLRSKIEAELKPQAEYFARVPLTRYLDEMLKDQLAGRIWN